jgi:hypothetical protein
VYGSHEERKGLERVAKLCRKKKSLVLLQNGHVKGIERSVRTLLAMMASSGASNDACGPRRAPAADASYMLEVCRNSAVRSRACLAGDAGVVASK